MPGLVVFLGPPASGKATVGHELARLAGFRLFHNHLTADPAAALFGWGTPAYVAAVEEMRIALLTRALDDAGAPGIVFTFVCAFDLEEDLRFLNRVAALYTGHGQRVFWVELLAGLPARLAREGSDFRVALKPSKRDVAAARSLQHDFDRWFRMNSGGRFPLPGPHLLVDTEAQSPEASARLVCAAFGIPVAPAAG